MHVLRERIVAGSHLASVQVFDSVARAASHIETSEAEVGVIDTLREPSNLTWKPTGYAEAGTVVFGSVDPRSCGETLQCQG